MINEASSFTPFAVHDGLAVTQRARARPCSSCPIPHGFGRAPIVQEPLAAVLRELDQQVVSFDPPGMFNTRRTARVQHAGDVELCRRDTGHAGNCRAAHAGRAQYGAGSAPSLMRWLRPERVKRLIIIGSLASASAIQRAKGLPWGDWLTGRDRLHYIYWGFRLSWGLGGNLALHKQMLQLLMYASYADKVWSLA